MIKYSINRKLHHYDFFLTLRSLIAMKASTITSSLTFKNNSRSINVTKQWFKSSSPMLFLNLFFTRLIAEKTLSTLAVATGKININLRVDQIINKMLFCFNKHSRELTKMIYTFEPIIFSHVINKGFKLELKPYQIHT